MILVGGATGFIGGQVCARLVAEGVGATALVRATSSPEKVADLRAQGVENVVVPCARSAAVGLVQFGDEHVNLGVATACGSVPR